MMEYERLTKQNQEPKTIFCFSGSIQDFKIYKRLQELEDKIEQGTLIEVVRCKDCRFLEEKHYEDEGEKPYIKLVCKLLKKQFQPNDFCSYAEKRLEEITQKE